MRSGLRNAHKKTRRKCRRVNSLIVERQAPAQGGEAGSPAQRASLDRYDIPLSRKVSALQKAFICHQDNR
jgi:hypothetical protein